MKRVMDVVCAAIGLLLLWPVFLIVAILIKCDSKGPIFFKQARVGRQCKPFMIYKFRTMMADVTEPAVLLTVEDDRRITRIGRFLRHTKLDELPQLINVVIGNMSLVGPRPEVARYVDMFHEEYAEILRLRPGITDLASIRFRNESRLLSNAADAEAHYIKRILPMKLRLARVYGRRASLVYDIKLILTTIASLVCPPRPSRAPRSLSTEAIPRRMR